VRWAEVGAWAGLALGLFGTGWFVLQDPGPSPAQFGPAIDRIRRDAATGDVIFLLPHWATRAREGLGDLDVRAVPAPLREDLELARRAWVFALFGAHRDALSDWKRTDARLALHERFDGGIHVLRFDLPAPAKRVFDFVQGLESAQVFHRTRKRVHPCDTKRRLRGTVGWDCPTDGDWLYVAPEWHRMGDAPRRCLWAHPPAEGRLRIAYPRVPLDGTLVGRGGHTTYSSRRARAPVDLTIEVETSSRSLAAHTVRFELSDTWKPFRLDLSGLPARTATVAFSVFSPDAGANHFCFAADMREPAPEPVASGAGS
jgi:hypothetical protein